MSTEGRVKELINENFDLGGDQNLDAKLADAGISSVQLVAFGKLLAKEFKPLPESRRLRIVPDPAGFCEFCR